MDEIVNELQSTFEVNASRANAVKMEKYMKNQCTFLGIRAPLRKKLSRPLLQHRFSPDEIVELAQTLWQETYREYQYLAMDLLEKNVKRLDASHLPFIEKLISTKSWWDTVDKLASNIAGIILLQDPKEMGHYAKKWMTSENMWFNRTSIIFQLKYKDETRPKTLAEAISANAGSDEFFLRKAIGWALRQYSKTDPEWVLGFMQRTELLPLSVREGSKYL